MLEDPECRWSSPAHPESVPRIDLGEEVLDQKLEVFAPRAECGHLQHHPPESVVQVFAEGSVFDRGLEVPVRRRNESHVHAPRPERSHRPNLAALEKAQQHDLRVKWKIADLVEEDRPAVRHCQKALLLGRRPRERAPLVAEELAQEQLAVQRTGVDGLEPAILTRAQLPDRPGHELLAGARWAGRRGARRVMPIQGKNIWRLCKTYGRLIGVPELKPHDLRHGVAMEVLEQHHDLEQVRALLGHTRVDTTQIYATIRPVQLKRAVAFYEDKASRMLGE